MKKYLTIVLICVFVFLSFDYLYYFSGVLYWKSDDPIACFTKAYEDKLWIKKGKEWEVFDIKGVNLGLGKPGKFATDYDISYDEYIRWFSQIKDLGANVIRTYTIAHDDFYRAFYDYNKNNPDPLYLIHGVWVNDYSLHSRIHAFDDKFYNDFLNSCKDVVDIIHGRHKSLNLGISGVQTYKYDISPWVYGYILGVEWESDIVAFTNKTLEQQDQVSGTYLNTEDANNFEIFLADIGDKVISYETEKYRTQRSVAFSNWPSTDPLVYPENVALQFRKFATINVDNIKSTSNFSGGQYASYHIYPYYPEYMAFMYPHVENSYLTYLTALTKHHQIPVVISEFGVPSSRGIASYEQNIAYGRNQGHMNEKEQGEAIVSLYNDIKKSGCAGGIVFIWQDEWFKRTWNTIPFVDLKNIVFWSDFQTNEQAFGLLTFDPGKKESICYVDGDKSDWAEDTAITLQGGYSLYFKYDEKFLYFLVEKDGLNYEKDKIYIPIDLTSNSGSTYISNYNIKTSHPTDFLIEIDNKDNSRVWVQQRYHTTNAIYGNQLKYLYNQFEHPPAKDSPIFEKITMVLHELDYFEEQRPIPFEQFDFANEDHYFLLQTYETGNLTYGNANPAHKDFNSMADFCFGEDFVEIKLPWQLLNFSDPSHMEIHDDYYEVYGVEHIKINDMGLGVGTGNNTIEMVSYNLESLKTKPEYHERLKESYYILQEAWQ